MKDIWFTRANLSFRLHFSLAVAIARIRRTRSHTLIPGTSTTGDTLIINKKTSDIQIKPTRFARNQIILHTMASNMTTAEKDHTPAPAYEAPGHTPEYHHSSPVPMETINRGPAASPGPQMVMVPNVAPPQQVCQTDPFSFGDTLPISGSNSSQQAATQLNLLRDRPEFIWCPATGRVCQSRPDSKDSDKTWFAVIGICLICPCVACIPLKGCCGDGMLQGELRNPRFAVTRWQTRRKTDSFDRQTGTSTAQAAANKSRIVHTIRKHRSLRQTTISP